VLGVGLGGSLALRATLDDDVRDNTREHPDRWGTGGDFFSVLGEAYVQWPVLFGTYAWSLHDQNAELHQVTTTTISALTLTSASTLLIKAIANTDRPNAETNGGHFGFPSYHSASSFAIAAVLDEYYGPQAGIPAYALAGLIGWSRIDGRDHDLSDVVFGGVLGIVIGKSVATQHLYNGGRFQLVPWYDPLQGANGAALETRF
jgi:membrane-associated phospholipid phosphatase